MLLIRNPGENYSRMAGGNLMLGGSGQQGEERIQFILRSKQSEGKMLVTYPEGLKINLGFEDTGPCTW